MPIHVSFCGINPQTIRTSLSISETQIEFLISFSETDVLQIFRQSGPEIKDQLFQSILKTFVSSETLTPSFQSQLCVDAICSSVALLSQILGSNDDSKVTKVMLGVFVYLSQSGAKCLNFDEFLAGKINSLLVNFHLVRHFRYQVYLYALMISSNKQVLE